MDDVLQFKIYSNVDRTFLEGSKVQNLIVKCIHNEFGIQQILAHELAQVSRIPLCLDEPILLDSIGTGPWRVQLPRRNQNYVVYQNSDQILNFGKIARKNIFSNINGHGFLTLRFEKFRPTFFFPRSTVIGFVDFSTPVKRPKCSEKIALYAEKDMVCPAMQTVEIPVVTWLEEPPLCKAENHGMDIIPFVLGLSLSIQDITRHVYEDRKMIAVKNCFKADKYLKKHRIVAYAHCMHTNYEKSMHYKP